MSEKNNIRKKNFVKKKILYEKLIELIEFELFFYSYLIIYRKLVEFYS